jgi:xanthine dehydrogenase accessory factor
MRDFLETWLTFLRKYGEAAVATVINGTGSRPRENGAQMLIAPTKRIAFTVGGGRLEADVIACAAQVLSGKESVVHHFILTGNEVALSDMICGGNGDVAVFYSDKRDIQMLDEILKLQVIEGWFSFPLNKTAGISFISTEGKPIGNVYLHSKKRDIYINETENNRTLIQWVSESGVLHMMGAGHVAKEISRISHIAGIGCIVYDDRPEFINTERFPDARLVLLEDMSLPPAVRPASKDMIAIVTRGHMYDKDCLTWALGTDAGYIGMIGSRRKVDMILKSIISKGFPEERVRGVFSPIGIDIGAQTPAEIAVSVVAELIRYKKQGKSVRSLPPRDTSGCQTA